MRIEDLKEPVATSKRNYIGIEFEFFTEVEEKEIIKAIREVGLTRYVSLGEDSSIDAHGPCDPYELRVLFPEDNLKLFMGKLRILFKRIKIKYNNSCGLHVHLDMRNRDKGNCYVKLLSYVNTLRNIVAPHRRHNRFCEFESRDIYRKYSAINYNVYRSTIEVRCKEMTNDIKDIHQYVTYLCNIVNGKLPDYRYVNKASVRWTS
jgi:hypothetical protein